MKTPPLDWTRLRYPSRRRQSLTAAEEILADPAAPPPPISEESAAHVARCAAAVHSAIGQGAGVLLIYGAHLLRNGAAPILTRIDDWLTHHRTRASAKSPLGEALAYIAKYRDGLGRFMTDGRVEIDNNTVERTIRPIALNRKNALFAGHDGGAENWAVIASLIETCKMNGVDPHAWMSAALTAIVQGHKQSQIDDLLPWNFVS